MRSLLILSASLTMASATILMESRSRIPHEWTALPEEVDPKALIDLSFFLKTPELKILKLEKELYQRSDPTSPMYGQWLSNDEVHDMSSPLKESHIAVNSFLKDHGSPLSRTPNGDIVTTTMTIETAELLLSPGAKYKKYKHKDGSIVYRCDSYSLPNHIAEHVSLVGPTTHLPTYLRPILSHNGAAAAATVDSISNTPDNLRSLYGVNDVMGGTAPANKQAVTAFLAQYYSEDDEALFFADYFPEAAISLNLVGDATAGNAGVESMLDAEYMPALGALIDTGFWGYSGASPNDAQDEPFLSWLTAVSNTSDTDVPLVFSTSYGENEAAEVPTAYSLRINVEFIKCALRGITLLFASGDSGCAGDDGQCTNNQFVPMWPAGSPFVTAVGGTTNSALPESAWSGSSGGFSNVYPAPAYQSDAIAIFLATADAAGSLPNRSFFNEDGRGFPDISAQATNYPVICDGLLLPSVGGTSCASPCSGGIFGLLNDARLAAGKSSLGFLNPMLYANPDALTDTTQGTQGGCKINDIEVDGFPAVVGWDAVTGLGSPNYERLLAVVMALP